MADVHTLPGTAAPATAPAPWAVDSRVGATLSEVARIALTAANLLEEHDPNHTDAARHLCRHIAALADVTQGMGNGRAKGTFRGDLVDWFAPWLKEDAATGDDGRSAAS